MDRPQNLPTDRIIQDKGRQHRATLEAARRFAPLRRRMFPTRDIAACAWADAMQQVTEIWDVEVGSRLYAMASPTNGPTMIGDPVAGLEVCSRSAFCSFPLRDAGSVPGGRSSGYVHTHPWVSEFSYQDILAAVGMVDGIGSAKEATAYLCLPNREIRAWSSVHWASYRVPGGPVYRSPASLAAYLRETTRRVR